MTTIIIIIAALLFAAYIAAAIWQYGVPPSLSETFYLYQDRFGRSGKYIFPVFMLLFTGLLLPSVLEITDGSNYQFLGFFMLGSLLFVGFAPCFKDNSQSKVHTVAAYISAAAGTAFCILFGGCIYLAFATTMTVSLIKRYRSATVYWLEQCAFISVLLTILSL